MAHDYKTKDFPLEIKSLSDDGSFEGYGSVFGNVDSYGDKVVPGAFAESLAKHTREGTVPVMLWQHNSDAPIGVWENLAEDGKGLYGTGRLLKGVRQAEETHILLKAKAVRGLSIGYRVKEAAPESDTSKVLLLKKLDLVEISVVTFPANRAARVTNVKSERMEEFADKVRDGEMPSVKEFESILRDVGFSKSQAVAIASVGYAKAVRSESEGESKNELAAIMRNIAANLNR